MVGSGILHAIVNEEGRIALVCHRDCIQRTGCVQGIDLLLRILKRSTAVTVILQTGKRGMEEIIASISIGRSRRSGSRGSGSRGSSRTALSLGHGHTFQEDGALTGGTALEIRLGNQNDDVVAISSLTVQLVAQFHFICLISFHACRRRNRAKLSGEVATLHGRHNQGLCLHQIRVNRIGISHVKLIAIIQILKCLRTL